MDEIIFQTLVSTPTGVGASTGKHTEEAFNENFAKVKTYLEALLAVASITVTSEQMTQIKVDTSVTPHAIYYSMDPVDTPASEITWYDLDNVSFADLQGNPTDNIALANILNAKAALSDFNALSANVTALGTTVSGHTDSIADNTRDISTNTQSISTIRSDMVHLVHSPTADGTLYLRYNTTHTRIEYSLDNSQWFNIASGAVDFSDISGNPTSNNNLVSYVTNSIQQAIQGVTGDFVSTQDFNLHVNNKNNPHEVTKEQIGLGNVDNTADLDKPIPTAMQEEIDALWHRYPETQILGVTDYKNLFTKSVTGQAIVASIDVVAESMSIAELGIFTCAHSPVAEGSVTITDDYSNTYTVDEDNNIVDDEDNVVGTFTYATGIVTSTGLEITAGSINYTYTKDTVSAGDTINLGHDFIVPGSISFDSVGTSSTVSYTDDGNGVLIGQSHPNPDPLAGTTTTDEFGNIVVHPSVQGTSAPYTAGSINYITGIISFTDTTTTEPGTVGGYRYSSTDGPDDVLYYTSSSFNGTQETINPHSTEYATKGYVDSIVGNINTVLDSLTSD